MLKLCYVGNMEQTPAAAWACGKLVLSACDRVRLISNKSIFKSPTVTVSITMQQNNKDEYTNPYPDFDAENCSGILDFASKKLDGELIKKIQNAVTQFTETVNTEGVRSSNDYSVYTGITGIALLNLLIARRFDDSKALMKAEEMMRRAPQKIHKNRLTFLQDSGPIAVTAVVSHYLGKHVDTSKAVARLLILLDSVLVIDTETPDECLYGRVGYLYSLLFVKKHVTPNSIEPSALRKEPLSSTQLNINNKSLLDTNNNTWRLDNFTKEVVGTILSSGQSRASLLRSKAPLAYQWHNKNYYGAAHGVAGILHHLLKTGVLTEEEKITLIKPTLDHLLNQRLPSGNFPSSEGTRSDRLVQWCHGAPGFAELLATAYKEYGEERYLSTALECGDLVWRRGLTTKGYSLCHGVAGNAYTFLQLYQLTGDMKHLYRAGCFADWCLTLPKHQQLKPDRPFSLFEGLAGVAYFLADIQDPSKAGFPAYSLQL